MHSDSLLLPLLEPYIAGFLVVTNLLAAWFHSNFAQHVWNARHRGEQCLVFTKDDLAEKAAIRYGAWGDLWVCPLCLGTWFSLVVSAVLVASYGLVLDKAIIFVPFAALTWPVGFYLVDKRLLR